MLKKGQLVRGTVSERYYVVLRSRGERLAVKDLHTGYEGWMASRYVKLIGNNYTAKDSKESAPVNPGF